MQHIVGIVIKIEHLTFFQVLFSSDEDFWLLFLIVVFVQISLLTLNGVIFSLGLAITDPAFLLVVLVLVLILELTIVFFFGVIWFFLYLVLGVGENGGVGDLLNLAGLLLFLHDFGVGDDLLILSIHSNNGQILLYWCA